MKSFIVKIVSKATLMVVILFLLSFFDVSQYVVMNDVALSQMESNNYIIPAMEIWKRLTYAISIAKVSVVFFIGILMAIDVFNFIDARKENESK